MEAMEMPKQMTINTPVQVGGGSFSSESLSDGALSMEITSTKDSKRIVPETIFEETSSADRLLNSAKEDGFEEALIQLSNGDFKNDPVSDLPEQPEIINNEVEEPEDKKKDKPLEVSPLHEKITQLEQKVEYLEKENRDLLERANYAESSNQANQEIMMALALALYEIAKKEENEEKKVGILEIIVKMLAYFMTETMTDYSDVDEKKNVSQKQQISGTAERSEAMDRLMQLIKERGQSSKNQLIPFPSNKTPHIENLAA